VLVSQQHSIADDTVAEAELFRKRLIAECMRAEDQPSEPAVRTAEGGPEQGVEPSDAAQGSASPRFQVAIVGGGATGVD
ncbi:NAD(P)/FAD-dependent oxidoreductase, partial [Burkholderia pseudomallei]